MSAAKICVTTTMGAAGGGVAGAGIGGTTCGQWSCYMLLRGAPAQNPAAYRWLTTSLRRNNQIILDKVPLLD